MHILKDFENKTLTIIIGTFTNNRGGGKYETFIKAKMIKQDGEGIEINLQSHNCVGQF